MKRVLFVDDEERVLEGLANALRRHRKEWEMVFACGAPAALAQLAQRPFDVIVTDARMPEIDGEQLLRQVQARYPAMLRIVLSGQTETEAAQRLVNVAHQFLAKPCAAATIAEAIERSSFVEGRLEDERLRRVIAQLGQLPALPKVYHSLTKLLETPDASLDALAALVASDPALSAKVLQVVNSAFFGLSRSITSVVHAIRYLGTTQLRHLVLYAELQQACGAPGACTGLSPTRLQARALLTGRLARMLVASKTGGEVAGTAGLLADVGLLVLASRLPEALARALQVAADTGRALHEVEPEVIGATHAVLGACLLNLWGLPREIVAAVGAHHDLESSPELRMAVSAAVCLASLLADEHGLGLVPAPPTPGIADALAERLELVPLVQEARKQLADSSPGACP